MFRAALFFAAVSVAFAAGYATRAREQRGTSSGRTAGLANVPMLERTQTCADDCEQTGIVAQASADRVASCKARCAAADPTPPHEVPRSITVAPADHGRLTAPGR